MKIIEKIATRITDKKIRKCYNLLQSRYNAWCISVEIGFSSQDGNYGISMFVRTLPTDEGKSFPFAGWGKTLYEALEMLEDTIIKDIPENQYNS